MGRCGVQGAATTSSAVTESGAAGRPYTVPGCGCFPGQTRVDTTHGSQAIATMMVGELVLAWEPSGHREDRPPASPCPD